MALARTGLVLVGLLIAVHAWSQSPPPRSARDITVLLDSYQPDVQTAAALKAELAQSTPGLKSAQVSYWRRRAAVAALLGLFAIEMDARRKLVALTEGRNEGFLRALASMELRIGNFAEGVRLTHEQARTTTRIGIKLFVSARMATILAQQGDFQGAADYLRRAESEAQQAHSLPSNRLSDKLFSANIERSRAAILAMRGRLPEAESAYQRALKLRLDDIEILPQRIALGYPTSSIEEAHYTVDQIVHDLADVQTQLGRFVDAELVLRDRLTENLKRVGRNAPGVVWMANGLAGVYAEQGRYADAMALAKAALEGLVRSGVPAESGYVLDTRLTLAKAYVGLEQWREASGEFRLIEEAAKGATAGHLAASGSPEIAVALTRSGDAKAALEMMRTLAERMESNLGPNHYRTGEAQGVFAIALAKSGEKDGALKLFRQALATMLEFEAQADETASGGLRRLKLVWVIEAYLELLAERHKTGDAEAAAEAFRVADVARAQRVQQAVTFSAVRAAAGTPELAELVRKEQDLGHEVASLYKFLAEQLLRPAEQQLPKVMADMRTRIERIAGDRLALLKQIEQRFPAYANLVSPNPPAVSAARQGLREGEALVALYSAEDATHLWAFRKDGALAFATVPLARKELQAHIATILAGVKVSGVYADELPKFDLNTAHGLYRVLLEPVATGWQGATSLLVVPHGPSALLPFAMLPTAQTQDASSPPALLFAEYRSAPWLLRQVALTQLPSVNAFVTLRNQPPAKAGRQTFAGFGDPIFNPKHAPSASTEVAARGIPLSVRSGAQTSTLASARLANLPRLRDTADEIRSIAQALAASENESVFLERRANEKEVKSRSLADRRILAFATHGLVAGDLDGLTQPALALTAPEVAGIDGDGLLTMEEVLALKLDADWVILSACNTASGEGAGAEAVSGLGRAFFYAGSRALLVSHWPVETVSAKRLTTSTIERYAKSELPRAQALRQSMLELLDQGEATGADGKPLYAYAHPLFWAPFSVIGEGN